MQRILKMTAHAKKLVTILSIVSAVASAATVGIKLFRTMKQKQLGEKKYDDTVASTMDASDAVAQY